MNKSKVFGMGLLFYLLAAVGSFFIFSVTLFSNTGNSLLDNVPAPKTQNGNIVFDQTLPKTEACPLNGKLYSKQQKKWWEQHRPLGVMVENHEEARPQSGLSNADVVYEFLAEGGITRFMGVFYCDNAEMVGPVRSARTYFIDMLSEYADNPLYAHVGGANTPGPANALGQIEDYGWAGYNDLNQFSVGFPTYWRDNERLPGVATEHTVYSTTQKLWDIGKKRNLTQKNEDGEKWDAEFIPWKFKTAADTANRGKAQTISYDFWEGYSDYSVSWTYDPVTNMYTRSNGGKPHLDNNTKKPLQVTDLIILYMKEGRANDGYEGNLHMLYGDKGSGKAVFFMDGQRTDGTWSKKDRTSRTIFKDRSGNEMELNPGQIWISVLGTDNTSLTVKP